MTNQEELTERLFALEVQQAKVITKLESTVENLGENLIAVRQLLQKHNDIIYGEANTNGLRGRVSKLEHEVGTARWIVGIAASVVAALVSFIANLIGKP